LESPTDLQISVCYTKMRCNTEPQSIQFVDLEGSVGGFLLSGSKAHRQVILVYNSGHGIFYTAPLLSRYNTQIVLSW